MTRPYIYGTHLIDWLLLAFGYALLYLSCADWSR